MSSDPATFIDPFADLVAAPLASPSHVPAAQYTAPVNRQRPTAFLFLVDQSASMDEPFQGSRMKSVALADTVNRALYNLITRCSFADGCRHYFDIGVIGYGGQEASSALAGPLASGVLHPVTQFEQHPRRVEERLQVVPDNAGGTVEHRSPFPIWIEPRMAGGTPMCTALRRAHEVLADWCARHPDSYPPTVIHVTDGQSTDGSPESATRDLCSLSTTDGNVLLFNLHITSTPHAPVMFASSESHLPDDNARRLFRMSSRVPLSLQGVLAERGFAITPDSRFFGYNADLVSLVQFLQIGSLAAQQR